MHVVLSTNRIITNRSFLGSSVKSVCLVFLQYALQLFNKLDHTVIKLLAKVAAVSSTSVRCVKLKFRGALYGANGSKSTPFFF